MSFDDCYQLGNVVRTHGLQGGLIFHLDVDDPKYYQNLESIFIEIDGKLVPFFIQSMQINEHQAIIKLEDVDHLDAASALVNKAIFLPLAKLPKLAKDQFYFHDLIGFDVYHETELIGKVLEVYQVPNNHLMCIDHKGIEVLIPMNDEIIIEVDLEQGKIMTQLPDGLIDVYLDQ